MAGLLSKERIGSALIAGSFASVVAIHPRFRLRGHFAPLIRALAS
jgi:hypothetical protein